MDFFYIPSHIYTLYFRCEIREKLHIINLHIGYTIKVYACYAVKIYNKESIFFSQTGGGRGGGDAPALDPPLVKYNFFYQYFNYFMIA